MNMIIEERLEEAEKPYRTFREIWQKEKPVLSSLIAKLEALEATFYVSYESTILVLVTGDAHKLAAAVRAFRTSGYSTTMNPPKKNDPTWNTYFRHKEMKMEFIFQFSSTVCRRVKVGTKMVEQDIYETVCGETIVEATEAA